MSTHQQDDEIEALIAAFQESGARELHLRYGDVELHLGDDDRSGVQTAPPTTTRKAEPATAKRSKAPVQTATPAAPAALDLPPGSSIVRAPYLGTFYRSSKPGAPAYVEIGSMTTPETEVCLIEVMKLFTAVRAGMAGRVHSVLVKDGQLVEANQPLLVIEPV